MTVSSTETPTPATSPASGPAADAPPWGADFDAEKAWKLVEGLRADKARLGQHAITTEQQKKLTEYERLEQASKTELDRKTEEATRWQSEAERWRTASVSSEVRALAAADFADPDDAARNLDAAKYLDAGGQVDAESIKRDLAALLTAKPHYRRPEGTTVPRVPVRNAAQGSGAPPVIDPAAEFAAIIQGRTGP